MARKPENTFIAAVHKLLPTKEEPHREKMSNPFLSGTADVWYSGTLADLWIEFKYIPKLPVAAMISPDCSPLQLEWLEGRYLEGRNVAVVLGSPEGSVIYRCMDWTVPITPAQFRERCLSKQELADWIVLQTLRGP